MSAKDKHFRNLRITPEMYNELLKSTKKEKLDNILLKQRKYLNKIKTTNIAKFNKFATVTSKIAEQTNKLYKKRGGRFRTGRAVRANIHKHDKQIKQLILPQLFKHGISGDVNHYIRFVRDQIDNNRNPNDNHRPDKPGNAHLEILIKHANPINKIEEKKDLDVAIRLNDDENIARISHLTKSTIGKKFINPLFQNQVEIAKQLFLQLPHEILIHKIVNPIFKDFILPQTLPNLSEYQINERPSSTSNLSEQSFKVVEHSVHSNPSQKSLNEEEKEFIKDIIPDAPHLKKQEPNYNLIPGAHGHGHNAHDKSTGMFVSRKPTQGTGDYAIDGVHAVSSTEIDNIMLKSSDTFIMTIALDEIKYILSYLNKNKPMLFSFIFNTLESDAFDIKGMVGHFIAVYCDLENDMSIDVYNPVGNPITDDLMDMIIKPLKRYIEEMTHHFVKLKDNTIRQEPAYSYLCSFYCIRFILMREQGLSFKHATGFKNMLKNEKDVEHLKEHWDEFKYI